jgi:hypothetical protein
MKIIAAMLSLLVVASGEPQRSPATLIDLSPSGSPVVLSGAVTTTDENAAETSPSFSFSTNIEARNVSDKDVLLLAVEMEVRGAAGFEIKNTDIDDYSFISEVLKPVATTHLKESVGPLGYQSGVERRSTIPTVRARVTFVQFLDGSIWGSSDSGKKALSERPP